MTSINTKSDSQVVWFQDSYDLINAYGEYIPVLNMIIFGRRIQDLDAYRFYTFDSRHNFLNVFCSVIHMARLYKKSLQRKRNYIDSCVALSRLKNSGHKVLSKDYADMTQQQLVINFELLSEQNPLESAEQKTRIYFEKVQAKIINSLAPKVKSTTALTTDINLQKEIDHRIERKKLINKSQKKTPLYQNSGSINQSIERRFIRFL